MQTQWVPFTLAWDDNVPLDLSFLYEKEKPAGVHGFLKTQGDRFAWQDGSAARFWGTCFNSGQNFPTHAHAEMVARRLGKFGLNMMRTHQMDAEWASPNIFQSNRAKPKDNTRSFDLESIDRLDYLIYCLKQEGIYTYLDLLTYRQFRPGDGVDAVRDLPQAAKPYFYFDPRLLELQKEFNRALWTHTNPYTGLAYCDDPAIALSELVNEADLFSQPVTLEPYRTRFEALYREWAKDKRTVLPVGKIDFSKPDAQMAQFFFEVMSRYNKEMIAHLRDCGVKIPINGTNWSQTLGVTAAQRATDFSDSHCYWNFPTWETSMASTESMLKAKHNTFAYLALERMLDKPFFVSEWDHAWPDEWRAESPLIYAALAAYQGWGGMTIHTYRYTASDNVDCIGGGTSTINGITYRNHYDTFNDPAKFGLFYQAALLLRRGDVQEAKSTLAIKVPDHDPACYLKRDSDIPALEMIEAYKVGLAFPGSSVNADKTVNLDTLIEPGSEIFSDTGELYRNREKGYGWIDTPRTVAAYGFLGSIGSLILKSVELVVKTDFATIALSSLSDEPIDQSDTLLLSAVGRSDNSGTRYDAERKKMLDFGHAPILIEPIEASVSIKTTHPHLKVWVISDKGQLVTPVPSEYHDGVLSFKIGAQPWYNPSTMFYLIRF